ncbi:MAG TPA: indolepyruvate ferredoxin oxidoreductase [Desulfobacteraceae bacterium]|nr:indolepyruvate ferredoxin oxidoreductase [Desulfobacteraceae bacterium]
MSKADNMPLNLIITGVGGQGNVLASQIIGKAVVKKGFRVTIGETFGLSQRGGAVMSHVRISKNKNCGPLVPPNMANIVIGLEPLETLRVLAEYGNRDALFLVNSRPIYPLNVIAGEVEYPDADWIKDTLLKSVKKLYWMDGTAKAIELGGPIMLNMIMLGALCTIKNFPITVDDLKGAIKNIFPDSKLKANYMAINVGSGIISVESKS